MLKFVALSLIFVVCTSAVDIEQHPYQVSVRVTETMYYAVYKHHCGGSIINAKCILTAAFCVFYRPAYFFRIEAGARYIGDKYAKILTVRGVYMHEGYNADTNENNLALLYLREDLPINYQTIAPIALARQSPQPGSCAIATGWGDTSCEGSVSTYLLRAFLPIVSNDRCTAAYTSIFNRSPIISDTICAGYEKVGSIYEDPCRIGSGGPLTFNGTLVGVPSLGYKCCRPDIPRLYANIAYFYDWIMDYSTRKLSPE